MATAKKSQSNTWQIPEDLRYRTKAKTGFDDLGPLKLLPGKWKGVNTGWNMIALPFAAAPFNYRILMNQYNEDLEFSFVDGNVPNRGLPGLVQLGGEQDQFLVTLDYQQEVKQVIAEDFPASKDTGKDLAGDPGLPIHHEPGLWLYMKNLRSQDTDAQIEVARLASVPHGNSVLALGTADHIIGPPKIPRIKGFPLGRFDDVDNDDYLAPYKHYRDNPFKGTVTSTAFPGFHPDDMNEILRFANESVDIERTTILTVDSTREDGGVLNIPFVVKQAEPVSMKSTFWIQELKQKDSKGHPKLRLQYSQIVMLDFFRPRDDEFAGRAQWPHISINTLEKVSGSSEYA